jgi:histidyl-tRNA synthetase
MKYSIPKGLFDVLPIEPKPEDAWRASTHWQFLEEVLRRCATDYGFKEIRTPMFESTELFVRGVGESSDIVTKEMYTFLDKAERSMTLRPEGTASVMRAFVEKHLNQIPGLHKYFYIGPMFRYERPQSGRYRQHHQFGAEAIGVGSPEQDVEMIDLLCEIYRRLGLKDLKVMINSVGDEKTRGPYREALKRYLEPHFSQLSSDSQVRFSKNVLRILDSKESQDQALLENAPSILDFLSTEAKDHFEAVLQLLKHQKIPYVVTPKLVRGLDYYNKTVFEVSSEALGAHNTLGAGGRYDGLIADLGGPDLPSVGFATGLERVLQTVCAQKAPLPELKGPLIFFVAMGEKASLICFEYLCKLRHKGVAAEMDLSGKKVSSALALASAEKAKYAVVIGDRELESQEVEVKEMATREIKKMKLADIEGFLKNEI